MVLAPDEREIVKVARLDLPSDGVKHHSGGRRAHSPSGRSADQQTIVDRRSPHIPGYQTEPISPASSKSKCIY